MNYYISDLHLYDKNTSNRQIIANWNRVVRKNDDVYILGDIGHMSGDLAMTMQVLNGKKHLIIGNWDIKPLKGKKFRDCFVEIKDILEVIDDGERIILFHYPMIEWNEMNFGTWHMYGHIHNNKGYARKIMRNVPRAINVSAAAIGYTPRTFRELRRKRYRSFKAKIKAFLMLA